MRAMRKKLNMFMLQLPILDWYKYEHCKNEAREIDCLCCLCCRQVNAMLISSAKIPDRNFIGNCLTVSHTCLLYLAT